MIFNTSYFGSVIYSYFNLSIWLDCCKLMLVTNHGFIFLLLLELMVLGVTMLMLIQGLNQNREQFQPSIVRNS